LIFSRKAPGARPLLPVFAILAAAAGGCMSNPLEPAMIPYPTVEREPEGDPRRDVEEDFAADGVTIVRSKEVLVYPGGRRIRHGVEIEWYSDGQRRHVRHYDLGEPTGSWQSWYPDGSPRSEVHCGPEPAPTTWWHENGEVSGQGPTVRGIKEGPWVHRHDDGSVSEEGPYAGGLRVGEWTFHYRGGAVHERGEYRNGVRVGRWSMWGPDGAPIEAGTVDLTEEGEEPSEDEAEPEASGVDGGQ
jgi:antitoxin component YwqK of YwqJK toxin-antitoxin module